MNDAMNKLSIENARNSIGRTPMTPAGLKRNSQLDPSQINAMFPDAAAAIAQQRAEYAQQTGQIPGSNRNSQAVLDRLSVPGPGMAAARDAKSENMSGSWRSNVPAELTPQSVTRPRSSDKSMPPPMGQFSQPLPSASLRSPRPLGQLSGNIQSTTLEAPQQPPMTILSPYNLGNQSWASMSNTPMIPNFSHTQANTQNELLANATAMKLAALSTVNNRITLDDAKKFKRNRSAEPNPLAGPVASPALSATSIPGINTIMVNDQGQILNGQQIAALQAQQLAAAQGRRSRPNSPGLPMQLGLSQPQFSSPQHNGYLAAFDNNPMMMNAGLGGIMPNLGQSFSNEGYLSDHIERGRSPRGRRGSSKPPEDPTDPRLLESIPDWLRSLRLHKYTDNLKDLKWEELVQMDSAALEARGVNALGARTKMLKVSKVASRAQEILTDPGLRTGSTGARLGQAVITYSILE